MHEQFLMLIKTALDQSGVKTDYNKLKQMLEKDPAKINTVLDMSATKTEINKFVKEIAPKLQDLFKDMGINVDLKAIESSIKSIYKAYQKEIADLSKQVDSFHKKNLNGIDYEILQREQSAKSYSKLIQAQMQSRVETERLNDSMEIVKNRAIGASRGFDTYVKSLRPEAIKRYSDEIKIISDKFAKASETGKSIDLSKANSHLTKFKNEMKAAGLETASFTQILKDNISAFSTWYFIGNAVGSLVRNFKASINTLIDVDTFLTEISKTSEISAENLKKLGIDAFDYASKYGTTVQAYLSGVQEMSRAGYDETIAKGLAELSILAQSAGDMTAELANEYLIATNAAYKLNGDVRKLNEILDSQNQVTNRNAITMSKLAEATKIAGSQAASSGVGVDELTAAITTMGVVTQQEGNVLGRAFRGILMNLQQVKGEVDGEIIDEESFSKVEKATNALGVSLKELRNGVLSLRDPMQVLKELATEYSKLAEGDVRGANLISALGGKYRGNQLDALLSNWEIYEKVLNDYKNASGSAAAEAQKTADSIEGKLNKLTNTWNRTVANVADSDLLKTFIDIGIGVVDLADKLNLLQTALVGLSLFGTIKGGAAFISWLNNAISSTMAFGKALELVNAKNFIADTQNLANVISGLSAKQAMAVLSTKQLSFAQIENAMTTAGFSKEQAKATASTLTMSSAQTVATGTTRSLSAALAGLGATIKANPIGFAIAGLTVLYSAISFGIKKAEEAKREALEVSKQLTDQYQQEQQSLNDQIDLYKELGKQLELSNLSTEEATSVKEQLYDIQKNLINTFGDEAHGIDLVNGKYREQLGLLSELSKDKAREYLAENRKAFQDATKELNEIRHYKLGNLKYRDKNLVEFLKAYQETEPSLKVLKDTYAYREGQHIIRVSANVEEADRVLHQLYNDIELYGETTGEDVSGLLDNISVQLNKTWTDELIAHKKNLDAYIDAQVIAHNTLGQLYFQSKQVIEEYNKALVSGEGIEEAKSNLDSIKTSVMENTHLIEGSEEVFNKLFDTVVVGSDTSSKAVSSYAKTIEDIIKENEKAIDEYQKSVKTIVDSLSNLDKISPTEIIDLMKQFPELSKYGYTGSEGIDVLRNALLKLLQQQYDNLDASLKSNDAFIAMHKEAMDAANSVETLSSALSKVNDSGKFLEDVKNEFKELKYISSETLAKIASKSPELENVIAKYNAGLISTEEILVELSKSYETDFNNYKELITKKVEQDEEFFKSIKDNLPDWVKSLADAYNLDYKNWLTLQQAKLDVMKKLSVAQAALDNAREESWIGRQGVRGQVELEGARKTVKDLQNVLDGINLNVDTKLNLDGYKAKPTGKKEDPQWLKDYNKLKSDLDHRLAMDKITEKQYYDELEKLNTEYLAKHKKTHLDMYRKNIEEIYKGRKKLEDDVIKSIFTDLKFEFDMDNIDENEYYTTLRKYNDKYYKGVEKYQSEYRSNLLALHKWETDQLKKQLQAVTDELSKYDKVLSEISHYSSLVDKDSIESLTLLQTGYEQARQKAFVLSEEIDKLNKQYAKGKISEELYTEQLDKLTNQLFQASSSMKSYQDSIISFMKSRYEEQRKEIEETLKLELDALEEVRKKTIDSLNDQIKKYKDIVDEKKKSLRLTKEEHDYQKKVKEYTDNISKIEKRLAELDKAASSGDRQAFAEKQKLEEELKKVKDNLQEVHYDEEIRRAERALDESYDQYEKMMKNRIDSMEDYYKNEKLKIEDVHNTKLSKITELYENEKTLIIEAAELTKNAFTEAFSSINSTLASYSLTPSVGFNNAYNQTSSKYALNSAVTSIIGTGNNYGQDATGLSKLNQYLIERGYNKVTKKDMVSLAQALGLNDIKSVDDVQDTTEGRVNKNKILEALKRAGFKNGGVVGFNQNDIKSVGEHGIALVRNDDVFLKREDAKYIRELIKISKPLNNLVNLTKPNLHNIINNNSNPTIQIESLINVTGNVDSSVIPRIQSTGDDVIKRLADLINRN